VGPVENLCPNNRFDHLQEAAATLLPQGWSAVCPGPSGTVTVSDEALSGRWAVRLQATGTETVGLNSPGLPTGAGDVRFWYKALRSLADGENLVLYVIGLAHPGGGEVRRQGYHPPRAHVGDGKWHTGAFTFDFTGDGVRQCVLAPRINEQAPRQGAGEWLIDAVEVVPAPTPARLRLAQVWSDKPLAAAGDAITFSAFIENSGGQDSGGVALELTAAPSVPIDRALRTVEPVAAGSFVRVDWSLRPTGAGELGLQVTMRAPGADRAVAAHDTRGYRLLVLERGAPVTRQEVCTDEAGYWRRLPRPGTLQKDNGAPLAPVRHRRSEEIGRNPYGICAHLPRARDYEDPFHPGHLIDGSPQTYWSSQQRASPYPGDPPWVQLDFPEARTITQVNLVPYWRNTDFPRGFAVRALEGGGQWRTVLRVANHTLAESGPRCGDRIVQCFPLGDPPRARALRLQFERLPLAQGNYAEVAQGYKARLSGIQVLGDDGQNIAHPLSGTRVSASDTFTGWQNTASSVAESFGRLLDLGVKWVRVGQWGDQTEWAAVERARGRFEMDPVTDAAIQTLCDARVDILWGLMYGNALYERPERPFQEIGPIFDEGHPFSYNPGPRTEAGRRAFLRYVDFVVRKYGDRIQWWELWNEENGWYPGHEPEFYGKLLLAVARHIKSIRPTLKVMFGGTAAPAPRTTEIALREGAAPYLDATAFHPYGIDRPEGGMGTMEFHDGQNISQSREQTGWTRLEDVIAGVRQPFARHGKAEIDVWLNEWGTNVTGLDFAYDPKIGEYGCAKYLIRFYIYCGWLGLRAAWWALYNENRSQDWGILDQEGYGFRPMAYALQNVCSVVSDVDPAAVPDFRYEGAAPDLKVVAYRRDGDQETLTLIWAAELCSDEIRAYPSRLDLALPVRPRGVTVTDLYWGVEQAAVWSYADGYLTVDGLIVRDYPVVVRCW
jgi:hypothetical protein